MSDAANFLSSKRVAGSFAVVQNFIDEAAKAARQRADDAQAIRDQGLDPKIFTAKHITGLRGEARGLEFAAMLLNDTVIKEPEGGVE